LKRPRFPDEIETERLIIRGPRVGDGAIINAAVRETYADLHQWMEWAGHVPTIEESEAQRRHASKQFEACEDFGLQAHLKTNDDFVLASGLHPRDWNVPKFEIGYWCRVKYQGQGYVTEAVRAITRVGFEVMGANRIEIRCDARNVRSRRVAERCGYRLEATFQNDLLAPDGELRATLVFALLPEEFREQQRSRPPRGGTE
jgi:RimJ/RimL family protein N-acetyltransferase